MSIILGAGIFRTVFSATENFAPTRRRRMPCCVARRARLWVAWLKSCPSPSSSQRLRKTPSTASSRPPTSSRELGTRSPSDASTGELHSSSSSHFPFDNPTPFIQVRWRHGLLAALAHVGLDLAGALQGRRLAAGAGVGPARARSHRRYRRANVQGEIMILDSIQVHALVCELIVSSFEYLRGSP